MLCAGDHRGERGGPGGCAAGRGPLEGLETYRATNTTTTTTTAAATTTTTTATAATTTTTTTATDTIKFLINLFKHDDQICWGQSS